MKLGILTIISIALQKIDPGKYKSDMQGIEVDLLAIIDGEMKSL
ncbi:hypothetical protein [Treponema primitia]|nr:hypothetical protein [Treponema primitia]